MAPGFSNVIQILDNQFNNGVIGLADDGGDNHVMQGNNFNGNSLPLRVAGTSSIVVVGNTFENQLSTGLANVLFADTSWAGGGAVANKGACKGGLVQGNTFAAGVESDSAMLVFSSAYSQYHTGLSVTGNHFQLKAGRGSAISVTSLRWSFCGFNQDDAGSGYFHYSGVHNDSNGNTLLTPGSTAEASKYLWGRADVPSQFVGGIRIGAVDATISQFLSASASWDPGTIAAGGFAYATVSVSGAALGDTAVAGFDQNLGAGAILSTFVSGTNQVVVTVYNALATSLSPGSGTLRVDVWKRA
jgi:hypothetical protein